MAARRILIVDHDDADAEEPGALLARSGYIIAPIATVGSETISIIERAAPHLHPVHDTAGVGRVDQDRFFAVSVDMLCCLDFDGYFKRLNPAWERTLGFTIAELMSRPFLEFVHPDDRERTLEQNRQVRGGGHALGFENRYLCKDGSYRWLHWNAAPDSGAQVIYSAARDVTAKKQADEERDRLMAELQTALGEVNTLQGILPICSYCKKIRDDEDYWQTVEGYFSQRTNTLFSHSVCPVCYVKEIEPQLAELERDDPA